MSRTNVTLLSQLLRLKDRSVFNQTVIKHDTEKHSKCLDIWTHLVSMVFMQLAQASSLRDISTGLRSATGDLNHMGVANAPSKSAISYRKKQRDRKSVV